MPKMADPETLKERARDMRTSPTGAEKEFWRALKNRGLIGFKFRRQVVIGNYIVDFCCYQTKVIVEFDGSGHENTLAYDLQRKAWLESQGFKVLRFGSEIVLWSDAEILGAIAEACKPEDYQECPLTQSTNISDLSREGRGS